jgi:hypothetical protein
MCFHTDSESRRETTRRRTPTVWNRTNSYVGTLIVIRGLQSYSSAVQTRLGLHERLTDIGG